MRDRNRPAWEGGSGGTAQCRRVADRQARHEMERQRAPARKLEQISRAVDIGRLQRIVGPRPVDERARVADRVDLVGKGSERGAAHPEPGPGQIAFDHPNSRVPSRRGVRGRTARCLHCRSAACRRSRGVHRSWPHHAEQRCRRLGQQLFREPAAEEARGAGQQHAPRVPESARLRAAVPGIPHGHDLVGQHGVCEHALEIRRGIARRRCPRSVHELLMVDPVSGNEHVAHSRDVGSEVLDDPVRASRSSAARAR